VLEGIETATRRKVIRPRRRLYGLDRDQLTVLRGEVLLQPLPHLRLRLDVYPATCRGGCRPRSSHYALDKVHRFERVRDYSTTGNRAQSAVRSSAVTRWYSQPPR